MYAQRTAHGVRLTLEGVEARLLDDLTEVLADLVAQASPRQAEDPFAFWEATSRTDERIQRDPALARLFPRASTDADADHHLGEFARVIVAQQRLDEVAVVRADLGRRASPGLLSRSSRVDVPSEHVDPWLRTLNAVNLLLTARLGMVDQDSADEVTDAVLRDEDDPRAVGFHMHQWVAGTMESILDVL